MPRYFYEFRNLAGAVIEDDGHEEHQNEDLAVAHGERVARELARNQTLPSGFIVVRNEAKEILREIELAVHDGSFNMAS
jgi:hypothetical protein